MRLKRLEIKGFKSFANETVIHFNEDIVGIVGPNGSGKSNVVDAIRWVLGEQKSKELRLDTMSSVIFNGTKKKKQSGLAQVSLTFENTKNVLPTDYNSVTVTRMLYRSGESEYRLNNVPCRLKDITSLFLDTGIGSNSYAIIALGMVDDILQDKDNARRKMFEQAAGISKYKIRKRETLNKLKNTTTDLDRVEDLLFEIDGQMKTLEQQARRTRRFFELKEKYKERSINLAMLRVQEFKSSHSGIKERLEKSEDEYRGLDVGNRQLEAKLESEKKNNLDKEKALSDHQRELNQFTGRIRGMENDKKILQQKVSFIEENRGMLDRQIEQSKIRIEQLEREIQNYRTNLSSEKQIEVELETQLDAIEEELNAIKSNHGSMKEGRDAVLKQQQAIEQQIFELEKQKAINSNQITNRESEGVRRSAEIKQRTDQIGTVQQQLDYINKKESEQNEILAKLEAAESERKSKLENLRVQIEALRAEQQKINRSLDAKRNEFQLTKSMIDNFEGFSESIKFLSSGKNWKTQAPLLSDLIYVQEDYRVAIENYLDPVLNYYVVQNMVEAKAAIQLLTNAQKGKANFFILDAFKNYTLPIQAQVNAKSAIDLVQTDAAYHNLCSYLLERVVVVDEDAQVEGVAGEDVVVLAKSGRYIRKQYSLSGGSIGLFEGKKIGRKKNIEILGTEIKRLEREADKAMSKYYSAKEELDKLTAIKGEKEIQNLNRELSKLLQQKASLNARLENFEGFVSDVQAKISDSQNIILNLASTNTQIDKDLAAEQAKINKIRTEIQQADSTFQAASEKLSLASARFNEQNISYIRQQNKVSNFQQELSFREKQLQETQTNLHDANRKRTNAEDELGLLREEVEDLANSLLRSYDERKDKASKLTEAEQSYFQAREGINVLETQVRNKGKAQQDLQILINQLRDKFNDVKYQISSIAQRLRIEFEIDINQVINEREMPTDLSLAELELKVEKTKKRLDNYGEINPMAVQAYDAMKERHENITQQRDDINKAKDDLMETIKEIEETATAQFLEAFEQTRIYFIEAFRSLFTEDDTCDLILLSPEDPLNSKIEIVAKPKGKRPQTISQLSGGEKTLTATALLFSLYLLKPAPFCIFDEVDAPLDDANIEKFNNIIKRFSKDSQFIIVTHNKMTMAAVDVIYGVYMQEQGVSGVSPVDFRSLQHQSVLEAVQEGAGVN